MSAFIEAHRERFGVEPICRTLAVAPSSYYAARSRPPRRRALRDAELLEDIRRLHAASYGVYGARMVWHELRRGGLAVGRDRVGPPHAWRGPARRDPGAGRAHDRARR